MASFTIVIPTYNRARLLGPTLDSVFAIDMPPSVTSIELLVIDNNCTDGTAAVIAERAAEAPWPVRHIVETQQGLCYGRNRGLAEASGEHVVYFDDDIHVDPHWLVGYLDAIERFGADCVVGPVTPVFESPVPEYLTPRVIDSIGSSYSRKGDSALVLDPSHSAEVPGCNFGVRRDVARRIGGFNNALDRVGTGLLAGGDSEFGMRLGEAGATIAYDPRCAIEHVITEDKLSVPYLRRRWYGLGLTRRALSSEASSSVLQVFKTWRWIARLIVASAWHRLRFARGHALQRELECYRALGYLRGRPLRAHRAAVEKPPSPGVHCESA
ncbi:MAG: glycosyltransferase [Phycisphaera sp.]|nr:glycosyltransferase [Phycisphaera sp.]